MVNSLVTNKGKNIMLYRQYTENGDLSSTEYLAPSQFALGISQTTPTVTSTDLDVKIPLPDGTTNDDGCNTLTGATAGNNSIDNTTTYKEDATLGSQGILKVTGSSHTTINVISSSRNIVSINNLQWLYD